MNNIKKFMIMKDIGFNELQEGTQISKSTLSPLVNNDAIPSKTKLETLRRISDFLGVSMLDLLEKNISTLKDIKFIDSRSDVKKQLLCYSYDDNEFLFELEKRNYEVNEKIEYYLSLTLCNYESNALLNTLFRMLENSTYNDISEFLEISLNRLKLKLPNANSSVIPVELQIPLENESVFSARRIGLYTVEHLFFNLPRKDGNEYRTNRTVYKI